jgi:hypothetical protein
MKGTMVTIQPTFEVPVTFISIDPAVAADSTRMLPLMKAGIGGGYIELIPLFNSIEIEGTVHHCVAFCDEDGKRKEMPINWRATAMWEHALHCAGHPGLINPAGGLADYLVGAIIVLFGDDEFMEAL